MAKDALKLGFVPLCDSAPLIIARERGFFAEQGVPVELSREPSWSNIRDKLAFGLLDAAQMLATMPLVAGLGLGNVQASFVVPMGLSCGGSAITLGGALLDRMGGGFQARDLAPALAGMERKPTFAMVFPFSPHEYDLRWWLAEGGVDPDAGVRLVVVPPPQMVSRLAAGDIDGYCVGEPWNSLAHQLGLGRIVATAADIRPGRIGKVVAVRRDWADDNPDPLDALMRALLAACSWIDRPENRPEVAAILARPDYLNAPVAAVRAGLEAIRFYGDLPNRPDPAQALWYIEQMTRWKHLAGQSDRSAVAATIYRSDLWRRIAGTANMPNK